MIEDVLKQDQSNQSQGGKGKGKEGSRWAGLPQRRIPAERSVAPMAMAFNPTMMELKPVRAAVNTVSFVNGSCVMRRIVSDDKIHMCLCIGGDDGTYGSSTTHGRADPDNKWRARSQTATHIVSQL
jgi:hypothetical protein